MAAADKINQGNEEVVQTCLADKAELERELKILNEKLSSALAESNAKDDIAKKQTSIAREAIAGWEKAETDAIELKQELDKAIQQRVAGEERLNCLDSALKECMQQLCFVREEQEKRIHDAAMKTSREFEDARTIFEEKLAETSKRLGKLGSENTQLSKALLAKEKVIADLKEKSAHADAKFNSVMSILESTEKENASLKYEVRVLEKELEIRNEEREFNRRTAEVAHKQHLDSVKKIAKLDSESQRLRMLVRKRLPGPAALAKMKNEVEMLGRDSAEARRRRSNPFPTASMDLSLDHAPDTPSKRMNFLTEQLCAMEEENRSLKEFLNKKTSELPLSSVMYAHTASKLTQVEAQLEESTKDQAAIGAANFHSLASSSDMGSDEKVSVAESWTPSCKTVGASDIGLMDDFVEMEKLAIVSVDKSYRSPSLALGSQSGGYSSEAKSTCTEIVPLYGCESDLSVINREIHLKPILVDRVPGWLDDIVKVVLEQTRITQRNYDDILEDIKAALASINHPDLGENVDKREKSCPCDTSDPPHEVPDNISSTKKSSQQFDSDLSRSLQRIIDLIEGIILSSRDYGSSEIFSKKDGSFTPYKTSAMPTGYMVRVFQWKTSELGHVLQQFLQSCTSLLNGKADMVHFAKELTSALEWIMNHCFSIQDVSSMRDEIKKHFDWDEYRSESELEGGTINHSSEADKLHVSKDQSSGSPIVSAWNVHNGLFYKEELRPSMREEKRRLKEDLINMEAAKKDLEERLQSESAKCETLSLQLQEFEKSMASLQVEAEARRQWKEMMQDQIENHNMLKDDLDKRLKTTNTKLNESHQELENKGSCYEELEAAYLDQQLQVESLTKKDLEKHDLNQADKQLRTDWEITAASEKLAECQETILNLGKQLKALASTNEASHSNKVVSTPTDATNTTPIPEKNINQRSSLLDKMMMEDNAETIDLKSPKTKEVISTSKSFTVQDDNSNSVFSPRKFLSLNGINHQEEEEALVNFLSIVPSKTKGSGGLLKKLLWRRKKGTSKKTSFLLTPK